MIKRISTVLDHRVIIAAAICSLVIICIIGHNDYTYYSSYHQLSFIVDMESSQPGISQVFFDIEGGYNEQNSDSDTIQPEKLQKHTYKLPRKTIKSIRLDPINVSAVVKIKSAQIENKQGDIIKTFPFSDFRPMRQIDKMDTSDGSLVIHTTKNSDDPIMEIANSSIDNHISLSDYIKKRWWLIIGCGLLSFLFLIGLIVLLMFCIHKQYMMSSVRYFKKNIISRKKILNDLASGKLGLAVNIFLWILVLITITAKFVPFLPGMPAAKLDPSWVFGMNQAVAQGLSFGKEIVFVFGPYASIYTKSYHPVTDFMMIGGSLYLALSYWLCFILLARGVKWRWILTFCTILAGVTYSRDALLFSLPLVVGLTTLKIGISEDGVLAKYKYMPLVLTLMFAPFGLLPLVKGSLLILCGAISALCSIFFIVNKKKVIAMICLASPLGSMLFFWMASGQNVTDLPYYFISMVPNVTGYTEAMAVNGKTSEVILYLVASVFLLLSISFQKKITITAKIFLLCVYFVFLFLSFKGGFVRHDVHAVMSGTSILIAAILFPFVFNSRIISIIIIFSLISWFQIDSHYIKSSPAHIVENILSTYFSLGNGIKNRIKDANWPKRDFDIAVNNLQHHASFPILQGSTDIYSYNQSYLISSGNTWSPRPIIQSYSVYTPTLAEENRKHLLGKEAPDNIIFKVEPIDGRVPAIEDGSSWPLLLMRYQPTQMVNDFLFLRKKENNRELTEPLKLTRETHIFGEIVKLPQSSQSIFAQIEIKPTFFGHIASLFYKSSQLRITVELKNDAKKQYRIIAGMAKSGFLLSPLIENSFEFGMLYSKKNYLDDKVVKSFAITPSAGKTMLWINEYTVTLCQIRNIETYDISKICKFDDFDNGLSGSKVSITEKCDGSVDIVNDITPVPAHFTAKDLLSVKGWLATSADKGTIPEAVYVVLTDDHGHNLYLRTRRTPRPDVGAHFRKTGLNDSGFSTIADISRLNGMFILGLAVKQFGKIKICSQFKFKVKINN